MITRRAFLRAAGGLLGTALTGNTAHALASSLGALPSSEPDAADHDHPLLRTYFVSPDGDDRADGLTPSGAWATIEAVNEYYARGEFMPGDAIRFEGGRAFAGSLNIAYGGLAHFPITIGSYGAGRAVIRRRSEASAVIAHNVSHVVLEDLELDGIDRLSNAQCGLYLTCNRPQQDITLRNLVIRGWGEIALLIESMVPVNGLVGVLIEDVVVEENRGGVGLYIGSRGGPSYSFLRDVTVRRTRVSDTIAPEHAAGGAGLVLEYCDGFLIEDVELARNGAGTVDAGTGGPAGMWTAYARNGIIRRVEAHHNVTSNIKDGSGIDLDAGTQNVIVEHCYTHHNAGSGLMAYHWDAQGEIFGGWQNNVYRYNLSVDDGLSTPNQGAVYVAQHGAGAHRLAGLDVYGNTIVVTRGTRPAIAIGTAVRNVRFRNNLVVSRSAERPLVGSAYGAPDITFQGNNWYAASGHWAVDWDGVRYGSLSAWRTCGSHVEGGAYAPVGTDHDPLLANPTDERTVGLGGDLASVDGYRLQRGSTMTTAGVDLRALYTLPLHDFYDAPIYALGMVRAVGAAIASEAATWRISASSASSAVKMCPCCNL